MDIFLSILALLFVVLGVIGCIVPIIPGTLLSFLGLLLSYFCSFSTITTNSLLIWLALSVVVSIIDYILPGYLAKKFGGSKSGVMGATIGMVVGFIFFNIPGVIFGPFIGAIIGELKHNRDDFSKAVRVGLGSLLSFVVGTGIKLIVSIYILVIVWGEVFEQIYNVLFPAAT